MSSTHVIAFGNEKGGAGKSTTAMQICVALAREGARVGAIDLDVRQRSFVAWIRNRLSAKRERGVGEDMLPMPELREIGAPEGLNRSKAEDVMLERFDAAMDDLLGRCDAILIDCPGTDSYLSRLGHVAADTVVSPLNDSFVDFSMLADWDPHRGRVLKAGVYTEVIRDSRELRAEQRMAPLDWVVMRNRLTEGAAKKSSIASALEQLGRQVGFRVATGFQERAIYRDLYLHGLSVCDLMDPPDDPELASAYRAAREEVSALLKTLSLPALQQVAI